MRPPSVVSSWHSPLTNSQITEYCARTLTSSSSAERHLQRYVTGWAGFDLRVGEREEGPIFVNRDGTRRLDRHATYIVATFVAGARTSPGSSTWP